MSVGPAELVAILFVVLLLFGSKRIADLGKGIGDGIRGFKRGIAGESADSEAVQKEPAQANGRVETQPPAESVEAKSAAVESPQPVAESPADPIRKDSA